MKFFAIFFGTIIGLVIFLLIIFFIIYRKMIKMGGFNDNLSIKEMIKMGEFSYKYNHKNAVGMTDFLVPKIIADFPSFSQSELYNKVETGLLAIFESLENKCISKSDELDLIKEKITKIINDYKQNKIDVKYEDVIFHKHAIKSYNKDSGVLSIVVSTSLEYFYEKRQNNKIMIKKNDYKRQTSYTTELIYIYDPDNYDKNKSLIGINCPNCGAPVKMLGEKRCRYCNSSLEDINLKSWHISSYSEDYN